MANKVRVSAKLKNKYNDPYKNFNDMFKEFKRRVNNAGILADYRDHEFYVSEGEKRRKKKIEAKKKSQMENLERKILGGEQVKASAGLIKKVMSNLNKKDTGRRNKQDD